MIEDVDKFVLEAALRKLSLAFDDFIEECLNENGDRVQPSSRALAQAKACLPEYCKNSFKKRK